MKQAVKNLLLSKWNIFMFCFSLLGFIYDSKQIANNILSNTFPVFIVLLVGFTLITIHYIYGAIKSKEKEVSNTESNTIENTNSNRTKSALLFLKGNTLYKILFANIFSLSFLFIISAISIHDKPIYYVVLGRDLTMANANNKLNIITKLTDNGKDFNSRIIKQPQTNDKYMIVISQGFIEKEKAITHKKMADNKLGYETYVSPPSYSTNLFKKILYLNTHYLPSGINNVVYKSKI